MELSEMGEIIAEEWQKTETIRKNVFLGEWIVMPNHFHGILIIQNDYKPEWKPGCLGAIINQFKSVCTKKIRTFYPLFGWQTKFHDHIVRNEKELERISEYIKYNPQKWEDDCYFKN